MALLTLFAVVSAAQQPSPAQGPNTTRESTSAPDRPRTDEPIKIMRLILKDGSDEPVREYRVRGERVEYFSSDRRVWEEMPASLVDWPATEKHAKESATEKQSRLREITEAEAKERAAADAQTPSVAPGIRLPAAGGVFLLDRFQGRAVLTPLSQNGADINKNTGGNILRGIINPVAGSQQMIELKGLHAAIQSHVSVPLIFVSIDSDDPTTDYTPETAHNHFRIVRCEEKNSNRVVGVVDIAVYGRVKQEAKYLEAKVEPVSGPWVKVSPVSPLPAGEYALVEVLGKQGINLLVWDFGVNAAAPGNTGALRAEPENANQPPVMKRKSQ